MFKGAKAAICTASALVLASCASGYSQFYKPIPAERLAAVEQFAGEPTVVISSGDFRRDIRTMYSQGYEPIGSSSFEGRNEGVAGAIRQAKAVGASHIVMSSTYARTVSGAIPLTTYNTTTAYTTGTATAFGSGGYASGTYNGTTTVTTPETTYMPYSVDRYDQKAIFFAPMAKVGMGVQTHLLSPEEAQQLGTNRGVRVDAVRRGSPAFRSNVLPGDVILAINGRDMDSFEALREATSAGMTATLLVRRNGSETTMIVPMVW